MLHSRIIADQTHVTLAPLTAPQYVQLRRKAAGLSIVAAAAIVAPTARDVREATALLVMLEQEGATARRAETLEALQRAFPIDPAVYFQLATEPADRHPSVCRSCGCSQHDACFGEDTCCGWDSPNCCTSCANIDTRTSSQIA